MSLERQSFAEEPLGIWLAFGDMRGGDQPECDDRRARPEPALARDAVEELEAEAVGGVDPLERRTPRCSRSGVPPSEITTSFQRSSATAAQSNPAPRLAMVAGARTVSFTGAPVPSNTVLLGRSRRCLGDGVGVRRNRDRRGREARGGVRDP